MTLAATVTFCGGGQCQGESKRSPSVPATVACQSLLVAWQAVAIASGKRPAAAKGVACSHPRVGAGDGAVGVDARDGVDRREHRGGQDCMAQHGRREG